MPTALLAIAAIAVAGTPSDAGEPIVFPSAAVAFQKGIEVCEGLYAGSYRAERSNPDGMGPFSRRGFYMSGSGDEAKVDMLMLSQKAHVYKATVRDGGVVYVVLTDSLRVCRVGGFDSPEAHASALAVLAGSGSGWIAQPTTSSSASARMQVFEKDLGSWSVVLNVSWPSGPGVGPNGLTAMATMAANPRSPAAPR